MSQERRIAELESRADKVRDHRPVDVGQLARDLGKSFAEAERLPADDYWARGMLCLRDALAGLVEGG